METILIRTLQLVMSFSLLVFIHEFGHFLFARLFKIRVEKFYIFFDPWFALFKHKPKNSETEYGIGWLPLGGYCKIAGMIDESMDTEQMGQEPQEWEFRSKPAWQRLLVMVGGVLMNFLLALFIYSMVLYSWGEHYVSVKDMNQGMYFSEYAKKVGFQDGDILLKADQEELNKYGVDMLRAISEAKEVTILRNGEEKKLALPELNLLQMIKSSPVFATPLVPSVVGELVADGSFSKAGIQVGDSLVAFNGKPLNSFNAFLAEMQDQITRAEKTENTSFSFTLVYARKGQMDTIQVATNEQFQVGVIPKTPEYKETTINYSFLASFPAGAKMGVKTMTDYVNDLKYVATKDGAKSIGGFATIATLFPSQWDWYRFWTMTAFISIMLAVMNLLPIPALDGGHILFLLIEIITRKKPSEKVLTYAQVAGMIFIFGLMIFANLNDVLRFFF